LLRRDDGRAIEIRPARRDEIDPALRLILAMGSGVAGDESVLEFLAVSKFRGMDLTSTWVAVDTREQLLWAVLPMTSPGKTMMLLVPPRLRPAVTARHVAEICAAAVLEPRFEGVRLVQALLDPQSSAVHRAMLEAGFEDIAELMYVAREVLSPIGGRIMPDSTLRLWRYDRAHHARFASVIDRTYVDTLDCPKLNGLRDVEDVTESHKASGEFDPELWHLLSDIDNNDLGVLLLNRLHGRAGYELVYIGMVPEGRGKRLSDALVRVAINTLAREGGGHIVAAVDAQNTPARRLYQRHGFGHVSSRRALAKTLSKPLPQSRKLVETTAVILSRR
jgi:GNAT superfamily N-acetyltransferase